jgi:hypothetical protein
MPHENETPDFNYPGRHEGGESSYAWGRSSGRGLVQGVASLGTVEQVSAFDSIKPSPVPDLQGC